MLPAGLSLDVLFRYAEKSTGVAVRTLGLQEIDIASTRSCCLLNLSLETWTRNLSQHFYAEQKF